MKIVVLGATGASGRRVVAQAIRSGHEVVAYARRPEAVQNGAGITVVKGNLLDVRAMSAAFAGANAVISCVGDKLSLGTMRNTSLMREVLPAVIAAARQTHVDRLVLMSAFGVGDTAAKASSFARLLYATIMAAIFRDKAKAETLLPGSGLNWTTVYPVVLQEAPRLDEVTVKPVETVERVPGLPKVPFANVAEVLVELALTLDRSEQRLIVMP